MKIFKVINNNMVSVKNNDGTETMLKGLAIGYGAKPGDTVDESKIEKRFILESKSVARKFNDIAVGIDKRIIDACVDVISEIISKSKEPLSNNLYLSIIDHVNILMDRMKEGYVFDNFVLWDLKRIYPDEYAIAKWAVQELSNKLECDIPYDEASFLTLHIVSAEKGRTMQNAYEETNTINEIVEILGKHVPFKEEGNDYFYNRFITHVRYLVENKGNRIEGNHRRNNMMLETFTNAYPVLANCVEEVNKYLIDKKKWSLSNDEKLYLIIHLVQFFHNK